MEVNSVAIDFHILVTPNYCRVSISSFGNVSSVYRVVAVCTHINVVVSVHSKVVVSIYSEVHIPIIDNITSTLNDDTMVSANNFNTVCF